MKKSMETETYSVHARLVWRDADGVEQTTPFDEAPSEVIAGFSTQVTVEFLELFFAALQKLRPSMTWNEYFWLWDHEPEQMRVAWDNWLGTSKP